MDCQIYYCSFRHAVGYIWRNVRHDWSATKIIYEEIVSIGYSDAFNTRMFLIAQQVYADGFFMLFL